MRDTERNTGILKSGRGERAALMEKNLDDDYIGVMNDTGVGMS